MKKNPEIHVNIVIFSLIGYSEGLNRSSPDPGRREKINLNFYFHTSSWCLKRFYEGLKGQDKKGKKIVDFFDPHPNFRFKTV